MVLGTFELYDGQAMAYVIKEEKGVSIYDDYFLHYVFNEDKDIVGFICVWISDTDLPDKLDGWFQTLVSTHYGNSSISFIQKVVQNTSNVHDTNNGLLYDYNTKLSDMKLTHIDLDDRKHTI